MAQMPQPSSQEKAYIKYNAHTSASNQGNSNQSNKATITEHFNWVPSMSEELFLHYLPYQSSQ